MSAGINSVLLIDNFVCALDLAKLGFKHADRSAGVEPCQMSAVVAPQLSAPHRPFGRINPMQLKNMLRRIHSNADNLLHGRLPCLRFSNNLILAH